MTGRAKKLHENKSKDNLSKNNRVKEFVASNCTQNI